MLYSTGIHADGRRLAV
nr:hypothetical protein [Escherichia albertii]